MRVNLQEYLVSLLQIDLQKNGTIVEYGKVLMVIT